MASSSPPRAAPTLGRWRLTVGDGRPITPAAGEHESEVSERRVDVPGCAVAGAALAPRSSRTLTVVGDQAYWIWGETVKRSGGRLRGEASGLMAFYTHQEWL